MAPRTIIGTVVVLYCALCVVPASAALKPSLPTVEQIFPQSAAVGETVQVSMEGNFLDQAQSLRFEDTALTGSVVESSFTRVKVRLSSAGGARPGLYAMRLFTRRGVSNLFHFRLSGWKSSLEQEPNDRQEQAQPVTPGSSVNGMLSTVNDSDVYRFRAQGGEVLAFNLLMGRNGWATGGEVGHFTLTLLDPAGRVLATNFGRFLMDPYFQHKFDSTGEYFLAVNHSRLAVTCVENECDNRRLAASYQLAIGRSPVLWSVWPPAARAGSSVEASLSADFIADSTPLLLSGQGVTGRIVSSDKGSAGRYKIKIEVERDAEPGLHYLTVPDPSGHVSPLAFLVYGEGFTAEAEPNDTLEKSPVIAPPVVILGRMDHPRDVDSFHFTPTGAEALSFRLEARSFGSEMVDPHLTLLCKEGDIAAANDDDPSFRNPRNRDSFLEFKVSEAASCSNRDDGFFLQVRDSSKHFGDSRFYLLTVQKQEPSFELGLRPERILLQKGRTNTAPLSLRRMGGFVDEVSVTVESLPRGVDAKPLVMKPGQTTASLELTVSGDAAEGTHIAKITGAAQIGGKTASRTVVLSQPMLGDGLGYVQTAGQAVLVSIVKPVVFSPDRIPPPGGGFALDRHHLSLQGDRRARILVKVEREPGFSSPVDFSIEGLPEGVVLEKNQWSDPGQTAEITVRAIEGAQVPVGEYRIAVLASTGAGGETSTEATRAFFLRIER